jgi:hypothetical protein
MSVAQKPSETIQDVDPVANFDPREFIIPPTGINGEAMPCSFRFQSGYDRQISILLASKKFPYITKGDFLRHAVHRHLEYLRRLDPTVEITLPSLDVVNEVINHQQEMIKYLNTIDAFCDTVEKLIALGRDESAREMVAKVWYSINQITDEHWKKCFSDKITAKYAYLIPSGDGISLLDFIEEDV